MIANDLHKSHGSIHYYFAAFDLALAFFVVIDIGKATLATRPVGLLTLMDQGSQFQSLHVFVSFISMRYVQGKVNVLSMKVCFFQKHSAQCLDLSKRTTGAHDWIRQATDVGSCYPCRVFRLTRSTRSTTQPCLKMLRRVVPSLVFCRDGMVKSRV